jgi:uncharacterized repeat protein (TIGR04042 family)
MPEIYFRIRWPDGSSETCYSPSLVIRDYFSAGTTYALADFIERSRTALGIASERVRAKYGHPCAGAMAQLERIESAGRRFSSLAQARVTVDGLEP